MAAEDDLDAAIELIRAKLAAYRAAGKRMFATSSFQSHSLPLLHILGRLDNSIPVYFTNTGFLFPETLAFADSIAAEFGIRADPNENRKAMREEARAPHGALRYHPMLHWTARMIHAYGKRYRLRPHPLEAAGYLGIGSEPCTTKFLGDGNERNSRWFGMNKTECGLHTELVQK